MDYADMTCWCLRAMLVSKARQVRLLSYCCINTVTLIQDSGQFGNEVDKTRKLNSMQRNANYWRWVKALISLNYSLETEEITKTRGEKNL